MMSYCWYCKQKDDYFADKLQSVRQQAKIQASETKQTMAIIKEGPIFKIFPVEAIPPGSATVEFISKHIGTTTQ